MKRLATGGRKIIICFDSDRATNLHIRQAETALATQLRSNGANPCFAVIPTDGEQKIGLDDLLVKKGKSAVEALLRTTEEFTLRDVVANIRTTRKSNTARHRNVAEAIVAGFKSNGDFIHTQNSLLYFDRTDKVLLSLDSETDRELRAFIDARTGVTAACLEWRSTFERLADTAHNEGRRTQVFKLAHWDAATGTWYRSKSASKLFRVTAQGWAVVDNGTDGVLIHTRGQMEDVDVAKNEVGRAAFDKVVKLPNFIDGQMLTKKHALILWSIYAVSINFPEALPTRPIPLFTGPKGSGKTSGGRAVLRTEYGARGQVTAIDPKKLDALQAIVVNDAVACLDNIDGKHDGLQNLLAIVATGGVIELRKLYTTLEKDAHRIECYLIATSRDPRSFTRDDVADRLLYFLCERRENFQAESELNSTIDKNRPRYWRWLLDLMPQIIKALRQGKAGGVHDDRMADFAKFARTVGPVLGYSEQEVTDALAAMSAEKLYFQADNSSIPGALEMYVDRKVPDVNASGLVANTKEGIEAFDALIAQLNEPMSAATLLDAVREVKHDFGYTNPTNFGNALRHQKSAIETQLNFKERYNKHHKRWEYSVAPLGGYPTLEQITAQFKKRKR